MHLTLAPRRRLSALYGPAAPAVFDALDAALAARAAAGIVGRVFDPEAGAPDLGVESAPLTPAALVAQLTVLANALARRGTMIESLWIVGGAQALPLGSLPNPVPDSDGPIQTDLVYGLVDEDTLLARWPVGRTPDADPPEPGLLAGLLQGVAATHLAGPRLIGHVVAISAARWAKVSAEVLARAEAVDARHLLSPPGRPGAADLTGARLVYCNLHGVQGVDGWFGQPPDDSRLVPAFTAAGLAGSDLRGAAVVSQACYGARLTPIRGVRPLALTLLVNGASALYVAHGLTYGSPDPPPSESDLLAQMLIQALIRPGARAGAALLAAQTEMLRTRLLEHGSPDADDVKTLLGFVLYGDPALQLS